MNDEEFTNSSCRAHSLERGSRTRCVHMSKMSQNRRVVRTEQEPVCFIVGPPKEAGAKRKEEPHQSRSQLKCEVRTLE